MTERGDNGVLIYRARDRDCAACALKKQCTKAAYRSLSVNTHEAVRQYVAALAKTEDFKKSAFARRKVEMLFAHLKRNLNFRRLRLRGMSGARDECTLAAIEQNLRKLVRLIGNRGATKRLTRRKPASSIRSGAKTLISGPQRRATTRRRCSCRALFHRNLRFLTHAVFRENQAFFERASTRPPKPMSIGNG